MAKASFINKPDSGIKEEISVLEGFKNSILNSIPTAAQIGLQIQTTIAETLIRPVGGDEAALFFLGGDVSDKTGFVDPDTGEIVYFDMAAFKRDSYDAVENKRYYELEKLNRRIDTYIPIVNEKRESLQDLYVTKLDEKFKKIDELTKNRKQIADKDVTGFTDAIKKGEIDDILALGFNFITDTALHAGAAYATGGLSMFSTMTGSAWANYNDEKSKALYGEDDPDRLKKLIINNEDDVAIPAILGGIGYMFERIGYKGMMREISKRSFSGKKAVSLLAAGSREGTTEYLQGLTEKLNENLGKQMSVEDSVIDVGKYAGTEEAFDNFFAGLVGGTGLTGGGKLVQGALRADQTSNIFINKQINKISRLVELQARAKNKKEFDSYNEQLQVEFTNFKEYLESNKKVSQYLKGDEIVNLTNAVNNRRDATAEIVNLIKGFKKGAITKPTFDLQIEKLKQSVLKIDSEINKVKTDANLRLLKKDLDEAGELVGDIKNLTQEVYETNEEFIKALEAEYKKQGKKMSQDIKKGIVKVHGTKIGNKILVNAAVAADLNAVATGTHEVIHAIVRSSLQANDGTGNLSTQGETKVKSFIATLSSSTLNKIEDLLEKGGYKKNKDGTDKEFKEYGEEYLAMYAQLSKEGNLSKNVLQKAGDWFVGLLKENNYKKIGFEDGTQIKNFLDAYVEGSQDTEFKKLSRKLAQQGIDMEDTGPVFSKKVAKETLDNIGKAENFDASNQEITNQLPGMVKAQVDNYFNNRPSLKADENVRQEVQAEILLRLINPSKTGRTDINGFNPTINDSLYGYLNKRINYRMLDTFKENPTIVPDFTKVDLEDAAKFLTTEDVVTTKKTEGVKTKLVQTKARQLTSLADLDVESSPLIKETTKTQLAELIKSNPKNIVQEIQNVLIPDLVEITRKEMGVIGEKKGELVIPESYKAYLADTYEQTISSMEILKIRTNYKNLFKRENMGFADYKTKKSDKPSLKKDSNYRKEIFRNVTTKAEFTKYHTEGKKNKLIANQRNLALMRAEAEVVQAADNYIIENSNDLNQVYAAELRSFINSKTIEKQKLEDKSFDSVKFSKTLAIDSYKLRDAVLTGENVFDNNGNLLAPYKNISGNKKDSKAVGDFVWANIKLLNPESDFKFLRKAYETLYTSGNRGTAYETNLIETSIAAEKIFGKEAIEVVLKKPTESDAMPDMILNVYGVTMNIEAKMANAQYSSVTNSIIDGLMKIKKQYSPEFVKILTELQKESQKGIKKAQKFLKSKGIEWNDISLISTEAHNMLKNNIDPDTGKSYFNGMSATLPLPLKFISEIYNNKKHPVRLMQLMGRGLFSMGGDTFNLGIPALEDGGNGFITLRVGSNSQYKTVDGVRSKTGMKRYSYRSIPGISDNVLNSMKSNQNIESLAGMTKLMQSKQVAMLKQQQEAKNKTKFSKSINASRTVNDPKGITVLDFDDTLATTKSLVRYTAPDGTTGTLNAEEYANSYQGLLEQGYKFDFSEFNKVVKGKLAPLFQKALKLQGKFGPENMFVLTARPPQAQKAIYDFLKANGLNIPLKNITGLGNSTAEAKALWIADKVGEGYNDFYFADDALQNVQAVDNMLEQFDVKRKVQQAKVKFSKTMNDEFNDILEDVTGIESIKRFDFIKARKRGASKGKFRFFIPPSHEDFVGLLYNFMGKGRKGDAHRNFLEQALVRPLNRANKEYDTARQSVATDYKNLNKQMPEVKKKLLKKTPDGDFIYQDAIRIYLWDKHGYDIPGLSPIDQKNLVELVKADPMLQSYADAINIISKQDTYVNPTDGWDSGDIRMDLDDATGRIGRAQFFEEFNKNADVIFSTENLNKIEAGFGKGVRSALEDMLYRIKTGRNKPTGQNKMVNALMNWVNGSVGSVMFFNMRSALLQQMSLVNYINFADNNIFAAAKAFANQKQYWTDWAFIFNSDMLKQRRGGIQTDVNGAELAAEMRKSKNPHRFLISKLLELGFLPTQIGDNIAIATGGATYYRNRVNTYLKQGLTKKEAEAKAFTDFQDITQSTQQSARPDMVSQQQASVIGKIILNFQNVTSQFNRLGKKAFLDIKNRRITKPNSTQMQSDISNAARITYYFAVQNAIFYTLQTALFAMMFDDDEEDNNNLFLKKKERLINGSIDSVLRGTGITGAVISTLKNTAIAWARQRDINYNPDESAVLVEALNFSPVIGIKARKIANAEKTLNYNKKVIDEMSDFDIDNPQWSATTNYIEAGTNLPLNRLYNKTQNVRQGFNNEHAAWERFLLFLGWSQYNLDLENKKMDKIKESTKKKSKKRKKITRIN